jgi:hypothetical protein
MIAYTIDPPKLCTDSEGHDHYNNECIYCGHSLHRPFTEAELDQLMIERMEKNPGRVLGWIKARLANTYPEHHTRLTCGGSRKEGTDGLYKLHGWGGKDLIPEDLKGADDGSGTTA